MSSYNQSSSSSMVEEEEEQKFYERYRQNESRIYHKVTFFGLLKQFVVARITNDDDDSKDKDNVYKLEQFWDNFLVNNTTMVVFIHSANILLLFITLGFLLHLRPISYSILWNSFIWLIVSVICLVFIIWYKTESLGYQKQKKALQMWSNVGNFILYIRFLNLISQLSQIFLLKIMHIGENLNEPLKNVILSIAIDFVQLVVFSTVPFPSPINFYITLQEFVLQMIKVWLFMHTLQNPVLGQYILVCSIVTILNWHILIMISALNVESTEKSTFRNVRALEITSNDKNKLINLISADTKSIVKDLAKGAENIKNTCINANRKIKKFTADIVRHCSSIEIVADNLLLLTRIADGKWVNTESWVNVSNIVNKVQNDECFKNLQVRFKITLVTDIKQNIIADADSTTILLRNSLFYWYQKQSKKCNFSKATALTVTCKLVKLSKRKQQQKPYMLVFKIYDAESSKEKSACPVALSKRKPSRYDDVDTLTSTVSRLKPSTAKFSVQKLKPKANRDIAKSNLAALMNLASVCDGYCEIEVEREYIEFGISCSGLSSEPTNDKANNELQASEDVIDNEQRDREHQIKINITKVDRICRLKAVVVAADFIKTQKIVKILERVGVAANNIKTTKSLNNSVKSSLEFLNKETLLSSDLILVDSSTNCESLSSYYGLLVLISSEDHTASNLIYHYCLPIYCLNSEIVNFQEWLGKMLCREPLSTLPVLPPTNSLMGIFSRCSFYAGNDKTSGDVSEDEYALKQNSYMYPVKIISAHSRFDHKTVWGIDFLSFSESVEESYRKMRILNPTNCWSHPTATGYWTLFFYALQAFTITLVGIHYSPGTSFRFYKYCIFFCTVLPLAYFKDKVFTTLNRRLGFSARTYTNYWGLVVLISWTVLPILTFFYVIRDNSITYLNPFLRFVEEERPLSMNTMGIFYFENYGGYTGREYIDNVFIHTIYLIGTVVFFLQWPYNVLIPLLNWIKLCLYSSVVMYKLILLKAIEIDYVQTVAVVLTTFGILVLISIIHFEWMNRSNYQILRKVLDCSDFIDDCYKLCHSDLVDPLKQITQCHQQVLKLILPLILKKKITLTLFLKDAIDSFNMQNLLIDLLLADLSSKKKLSSIEFKELPLHAKVLHDNLHEDEYKDEMKDYEKQAFDSIDSDIVYLKLELQEISAIINAYYNKNDFAIKIFTDVDDSLSVVKASKKFLRILVTSAILNSIAILKQDTHRDSIAGSWHEIHISAEPQNVNENIPFMELRWMRIVVKDSRSALNVVVSNKSDALLNYIQYKSKEVLEMLLNFDTYANEKPGAYSVFNARLPYRLHPCHQQLLGIISTAKRFKLKVRGSDSLLERYRIWSKSSHASTRSYSVLIVQYIPDDQSTLLIQSLRARGWLVVQVSSIRVVEFNPGHMNCDCIIIDYSRYNQIGRNSMNLLDEISIIKLFGYKGLMVGLFDSFSDTGAEKVYYNKHLDLVVTNPVIEPVIDRIESAIKSHEVKLLMSL